MGFLAGVTTLFGNTFGSLVGGFLGDLFKSLFKVFTQWVDKLTGLPIGKLLNGLLMSPGDQGDFANQQQMKDSINAKLKEKNLQLKELTESDKASLVDEAFADAPKDSQYAADISDADRNAWRSGTQNTRVMYKVDSL